MAKAHRRIQAERSVNRPLPPRCPAERDSKSLGLDRMSLHTVTPTRAERASSDTPSTARGQFCCHHRHPQPCIRSCAALWCDWSAGLPFMRRSMTQNRRSAWGCSSAGRAPALQFSGLMRCAHLPKRRIVVSEDQLVRCSCMRLTIGGRRQDPAGRGDRPAAAWRPAGVGSGHLPGSG